MSDRHIRNFDYFYFARNTSVSLALYIFGLEKKLL